VATLQELLDIKAVVAAGEFNLDGDGTLRNRSLAGLPADSAALSQQW
jgi:roadblock/LC7 domain-containing protein